MTEPLPQPQLQSPQTADEYIPENEYPRAAPIMAALTFVLFLLMMGLLFYRWQTMGEPNGFMIFQGSKEFDGATVTITDADTGTNLHRQLTAANNYQLRFPLPQGAYQVTVMLDNKPIMHNSVPLREGNGVIFNLNQDTAATEPTP